MCAQKFILAVSIRLLYRQSSQQFCCEVWPHNCILRKMKFILDVKLPRYVMSFWRFGVSVLKKLGLVDSRSKETRFFEKQWVIYPTAQRCALEDLTFSICSCKVYRKVSFFEKWNSKTWLQVCLIHSYVVTSNDYIFVACNFDNFLYYCNTVVDNIWS